MDELLFNIFATLKVTPNCESQAPGQGEKVC